MQNKLLHCQHQDNNYAGVLVSLDISMKGLSSISVLLSSILVML